MATYLSEGDKESVAKINVNEPGKVLYWLDRYKLTLDELKKVILKINSSVVVDVEKYLTSGKKPFQF